MKKYIFLFAILTSCNLFGQSAEKVDTLSIVFKAKLFTVSQYDYQSKQNLINFIDNMPYDIFGTNEFIFLKVRGRYYCQNNKDLFTINWCDCDYYICYSVKRNFFYLLGGFKNDNIDEFAKEYYGSLFMANWKYKIKDKTLSDFIEQLNLHKLNKAKRCFDNCTELVTQ